MEIANLLRIAMVRAVFQGLCLAIEFVLVMIQSSLAFKVPLSSVNEATDIDKDKFSGIIGLGPKSDVGRMPSFVE